MNTDRCSRVCLICSQQWHVSVFIIAIRRKTKPYMIAQHTRLSVLSNQSIKCNKASLSSSLTYCLWPGLMVLAAAKAFSASSVAITDIRPDNLPVAKQLGAKHALDQSKATSASDTVEALKAVFAEGPDIVIDCVGFESTITVSLQNHGVGYC